MDVIFNFYNASFESNEIVGEGTIICTEACVGFVVEVDNTRLQATNVLLEFFRDGSESSIRFFFQLG